MTGVFITFEGGDASGKSTQARLLGEWVTQRGRTVLLTREPGGTDLGLEIRQILLHREGDVSPRAEALLYAADRAHHIETLVQPALERGEIVIQDRYIDSSVAYQGAGRVLEAEEIEKLSLWAARGLVPDLTVLLDLDPSVGRQRITNTGAALDRLESEKLEFHERVRAAYRARAAAHPRRFLTIDAGLPIKNIAQKIRERVEPLLRS
ncbi:dTMP kinase [Lysinibacter sp. HNR]|uniref:dTMP kinase n=1 Tax=Lysinibacter sp. HNR TaxID=3031408 RepID=UPI002435D1DC|nr:dTMP kinase [Lysinibacter sp. HNR]WGD37075.1 dTMP kinase [Lysinibacter sp. HNR]